MCFRSRAGKTSMQSNVSFGACVMVYPVRIKPTSGLFLPFALDPPTIRFI